MKSYELALIQLVFILKEAMWTCTETPEMYVLRGPTHEEAKAKSKGKGQPSKNQEKPQKESNLLTH